MKAYIIGMLESLGVIAMLAIFIGIAYQDRIWPIHYPTKPTIARAYNDHWQKRNDLKMAICYQKMATIPEVKNCMLKLGAFI